MLVNLSKMPDPPKEYVVDFQRLDGGLNIWELDYRLDNSQSPEMENLCWLDGALGCRDGQEWVYEQKLGTGFACCELPFWEHVFLHIGDGLYYVEASSIEEASSAEPVTLARLIGGVPENRGTFFSYDDALYYKNRGGYFKISYRDGGVFTAAPVEAYTPITYINTEPTTGAGDEYQPENRLSPSQTMWYSVVKGVTEYRLPVKDLDSVDTVLVDEVELKEDEDYTVDLENGTVTFAAEPKYHEPYVANTVKITFSKENPDAYASVMDCPYATVYGGDQDLCVVVGGCPAQPNAYFWCGNHIVMDAGYFPFEQYNFAGDTEEPITGFGKQQALLVIFKENSVGKASFSTVEMASGRVLLSMPYTSINTRVGCDLPWSIQLIENNLVFCNTKQGVHQVQDSSSAQENNIVCLSRNVNGTNRREGLLAAVRRSGKDAVCSFDDDSRYWIVADGKAWVWDYALSTNSNPSWFYFTNISGVSFFRTVEAAGHLNGEGKLTRLVRSFTDYEDPIRKVYQFATQTMGSYDRLKDVLSVLLAVRSDTDTVVDITYVTDYEERRDLTPIMSFSWRLVPRNLVHRFLQYRRYATVARRKPGCRHVRHFSMRLENNERGADMSIVSAQIFYRYQGRER